MRAFSNFPPLSGRAPGILLTNSNAICFAFSSSLHTRTSQSTGSSPASSSAPRFCNAAARLTPAGSSSLVCSAAEPCHTPSMRVAAPPIVAARGTVVSITIVPGFHTLFNCLSSATTPEKGTVNTATSHAAAAERLSSPSICAAPPMRSRKTFAVSCAREASRDPIRMCSPAVAIRNASPEPSAPVPPRIAIFRAMMVRSVSNCAGHENRRRNSPHLPLLRFSRTQYGIFKNFQDANATTHRVRIPQSPRPFHHRRDRGYRRARARQNSRHDRQLLHLRLARSHADSRLCRPAREDASTAEEEKKFWRQRPQGRAGGHFRIFRQRRAKRGSRRTIVHSLSTDSPRDFRSRECAAAVELQRHRVACCRGPHYFCRGSGGGGSARGRAAALFPRRIPPHRAPLVKNYFSLRIRCRREAFFVAEISLSQGIGFFARLSLPFGIAGRPRRLGRIAHLFAMALHFAQRVDRLVLRFIVGARDDFAEQSHGEKLHAADEQRHRQHH